MLHLYVHYETYEMIWIYGIFQGVIFVAVMQSNLLHYNNWWTTFNLTALASIFTSVKVGVKTLLHLVMGVN